MSKFNESVQIEETTLYQTGELMNEVNNTENENKTVAKPETKKRQSTWAFLYDCKIFVAGQLGIARHQLQNEDSPHLRKIYEENVKEREDLLAEIEDRMKTANARDGDDYTPLF